MRLPRNTASHAHTHYMTVLWFWLRIQTLPCTLVIGSAEDYTKKDPSSPGEAGYLLSAAAGWILVVFSYREFSYWAYK